jgi:hypothetical protein
VIVLEADKNEEAASAGARSDREDLMDNHWSGPRGDRCRVAEALRRLKEEYDRTWRAEEDPDWVKEFIVTARSTLRNADWRSGHGMGKKRARRRGPLRRAKLRSRP